MSFSFTDPVIKFFDTATSDDGIAAATIPMLLGVLAFGMCPIPFDLGVFTVVGIFLFTIPSSLNFLPFCLHVVPFHEMWNEFS